MTHPSSFTSKRSSSSHSPIKGIAKRYKSEGFNSECRTPHICPLPLTATHGVEEIKYALGIRASALTQENIEILVRERQKLLFAQGRRVVGLPLVLDDGIVLHWVYDPVIKDSNEIKPRMSSELFVSEQSNLHDGSVPSLLPVRTLTSDPVTHKKGQCSPSPRAYDIPNSSTMVLDADASQTAGPAYNSDSDIEIVSFRLATDDLTKIEHPDESSHIFARLKFKLPAHDSTSVQDDEERTSSSTDMASFSRLSHSNAVSSVHRDQAIADLCGEWSSMRNSDDSVAPSSDDDTLDQSTHVNEAAESSSSRSRFRTSFVQTVAVSRGRSVREGDHRPFRASSCVKGTAVASNGILSQLGPGEQSDYHTPDDTTSTEDGCESDVSLRPQRLRQVISLSSDSSASRPDQVVGPSTLAMKRVPLPKTPYGRSRRLLIPVSDNLPLAAITMRGDIQFINRRKQFRVTLNSLPNPGVHRHVEDACVVGDTVVLGYNSGPSQITFLPITTEAPRRVDAQALPHINSPQMPRSSGEGVRCLAPMRAPEVDCLEFFTGGHDRRIFKWTANAQSLEEPTVSKLNVFLDSSVAAMAYRHHNNSLVSSDTKKLYVTDINRSYTPKPAQVSNDVHQIHVHPQTPNMTLLEVRHLDHQILIFDHRRGNFDRTPCCTFGYRYADAKFEPTYTKGTADHAFFARGHKDGTVLLWDFRNVKDIVTKRQSQLAEAVVHAVISDGHVVTFGGGVVTFLNDFLCS